MASKDAASSSSKGYIGPSSSPVRIDPSAPGTVIRTAIALEALTNLVLAPSFFAYPDSVVMFAYPPRMNVYTLCYLQAFGFIGCALTPLELLAFPNTVRGIESRRTVYWALMGVDALAIVALLHNAVSVEESKRWFTPYGFGSWVAAIGVTIAWRLFALLCRPAWFGRYTIRQSDLQLKL